MEIVYLDWIASAIRRISAGGDPYRSIDSSALVFLPFLWLSIQMLGRPRMLFSRHMRYPSAFVGQQGGGSKPHCTLGTVCYGGQSLASHTLSNK